jgi:polar amino acid transport system ATP-binding protein
MITIKHLRKEYPNATPLKDVNVTINKGDVISIIGPSGTGKSTLIRCINLLETPTSGEIYVNDELITAKNYNASKVRQKMGMVFQSFNLFNHMNVIENIMAAQRDILKRGKQEAYNYGMELLKSVGLADKAYNYPDELSGGQKQRVAIARALAMDPEILLLDEPTSALDPTMVGEVQAVIRNLAENGMTLMIVTHEMRFAKEIANRIFYMDEGGIYEDGTPEQIFNNPKKEKTIRFIKRLKVFEYEINSKSFDFIEFNNMLEEYGKKNQIPNKTIMRALSVFEELAVQIIIPEMSDIFKLNAAFEYSEDEKTLTIVVKYDGKPFDVRDSDNILSLKIAQNASSSIEYAETSDDEFTNLLTITIK